MQYTRCDIVRSETPTASLICGSCKSAVSMNVEGHRQERVCTNCNHTTSLYLYPSVVTSDQVPERLEVNETVGQSSCYYHNKRQAVGVCSACGRFLCALCELEFQNNKVCANCMVQKIKDETDDSLIMSRKRYDNIALTVAVISIWLYFLSLITAPIVLYMCIRYRKSPRGILERWRWRFFAAFLLASLQLFAWSITFFNLLGGL